MLRLTAQQLADGVHLPVAALLETLSLSRATHYRHRARPCLVVEQYAVIASHFKAKPNVRFKENFSKPHAWDIGKRFRRICKLAKVENLRVHDLRHFATTVLFMKGVPDAMIAKMTGHGSRELKRYQHLSPEFKKQTVDLIA
jgi:integrase